MNTIIRGLVLCVALAGLAGASMAQTPTTGPSAADHPWPGDGEGEHEHDGRWHRHHHHWHHHHGRGAWDRGGHGAWGGPGLLGKLRELDLTQAEREQIHTIMEGARSQWRKPQGAESGKNPMAALQNPGDPGYAAAVQAAKQRAGERIQAMSDLELKVYNVLTPEQKGELSKLFADQQARSGKWQHDHKGRGPGGV